MSSDLTEASGRAPHDTLGVPEGADREQVIRAFRRRVRLGGHPDTGGDTRAFEELVRARDILLDPSRRIADDADPPNGSDEQTHAAPDHRPVPPPSPPSPPPRTNRFAIAAVVLALLGPLWWPVAIVVGHVALRQIKRTGQGGGAVIPIVLLVLYVLTVPAVVLAIVSLVAAR